MTESNEMKLYQYIVDISWEPYVYNYIELIYNKAQTLEKDSVNRSKLIDSALFKVFTNLKNTIKIDDYDKMLEKIGSNEEYELAFKIIKTFYNDEFIDNNAINTLLELVQQHRFNKDKPLLTLTNDVLMCILSILYVYCVKK